MDGNATGLCAENNGGCHAKANCSVSGTAVTCRCLYGYAGDGKTCLPLDGPLDTVVEVPEEGPYGTHSLRVHAASNWVNTGLFLKAGESATLTAAGTWGINGLTVGPSGVSAAGNPPLRGCRPGSLVARTGLRYEDEIVCIGEGATVVARRDDVLFVGMIASTDLGEAYGDRLKLDGAITVTVTSNGATVPSVYAKDALSFPYEKVKSDRVELLGKHGIVHLSAREASRDRSNAAAALGTLDALYEAHADLRGMTPFGGQRIRFYPDETIRSTGYMLAGNPVRCVPELMGGAENQRILRANLGPTDIWGFAHELGHLFAMANGTWLHMNVNVESWPNVFTLSALTRLGRLAGQPHTSSYCDDKDAYLASGNYETFRKDPMLQLCFFMEFQEAYGWPFWSSFFKGMNGQTNDDVAFDGTDASVWRYVRQRFNLAAGQDVGGRFVAWRIPL
jgi:hypothetical protein